MAMDQLPAELLISIFSLLRRHDLANIVRVSSTFHAAAQQPLYHHVHFTSELPSITATLTMLKSNLELASKIHHAILTTDLRTSFKMAQEGTLWMDPDALVGCVNLRSLDLDELPFLLAKDQLAFSKTLRNRSPLLKSVTIRTCNPVSVLPSEVFQLSFKAIEKLELHTQYYGKSPSELLTALQFSHDTVTHISFRGKPACHELFDLRLPRLLSLELGSLFYLKPEVIESTRTSLTEFLIAHPTLTHLSLGRTRYCEGPSRLWQLQYSILTPEVLPALASFAGFSPNLKDTLEFGVRSFRALTSLSLSHYTREKSMASRLHTMKNAGECFPLLTRLTVIIEYSSPSENASDLVLDFLKAIAGVCPAVVDWSGNLTPINNHVNAAIFSRKEDVVSTFSSYENLKSISFPIETVYAFTPSPEKDVECLRPFALACPLLEYIRAQKRPYTQSLDNIFCLKRGEDGGLVSVVVEEVHN
ncbi:hypothetical protein B0H34DRAFT_800633 [Crassisporium funariophilum]|nr:hypothetical protein B0H34DRAFT_800633 [Crassisporium funariophilum]